MIKSIALALAIVFLGGLGLTRMVTSACMDSAVQEKIPLIEEQQTTEREKEHSRLFQQYGTGKNLRNLAATAKSDVKVVSGIEPPLPLLSPYARPEYPSPYLINLACETEAVVVGVLKNGTPHLTENEEFLFTDYAMQVEQVLKDNSKAHILPGNEITVTRPGGTAKLNGRIVRAIDPFFPNFIVGERYLLFLRFISVTGAYQAFDEGSFGLHNQKVDKLTRKTRWSGRLFRSEEELPFIIEVKDAIANICVDDSKGVRK